MNTSLRAENYRRRVIDSELDELLTGAPALSLEGAKGVGKSATAAERADAEYRLEVKLSPVVTDDDVRHLLWLRDRLGSDVLDLVIVTTGKTAYRRPDGVAVIPAALLGP